MKNKIKNILIVIQSVLIVGALAYNVKAAYSVNSNEVYYTKGNETVEAALSKLHSTGDYIKIYGTAKPMHILEGKTLVVQGSVITGTMHNYSGETFDAIIVN